MNVIHLIHKICENKLPARKDVRVYYPLASIMFIASAHSQDQTFSRIPLFLLQYKTLNYGR